MASAVVDPKSSHLGTSRPPHAVRGDIQALRAFAVAAVVLFHIWPNALTGGYVGVDVFFVISGYLITGQLVRLRERGSLSLPSFWAARARRLLPASLLVLAVSTVFTLIWAPSTLVPQYLRSVIGSALYVENWVLASDAVDYLGADNAPPIAQHYWSLSVEEQFYIIWPLLIIVATAGWVARGRTRRFLLFVVGALTAISLIFGIWSTFALPSLAYFATPARVWEFGFGALVALSPAVSPGKLISGIVWIASWFVLIASAAFYGAGTPFPGVAAVLPVGATAALIAVGPTAPFRFAELQNARMVRWVGDNSYSIYLWHWPLIVIAPAILGHALDLWENILLVALTVALAALTKRLVEDPVRFGRLRKVRPRGVLIGTAASMALIVAASAIPLATLTTQASAQAENAQNEIADPASCRGASLMLEPACAAAKDETAASDDLIPSLIGLYDDTDGAFACYSSDSSSPITPCQIGDDIAGAKRIAITGDSHAAMLVPGLRDLAAAQNWVIDVYVGRGCVWADDDDPTCATRQKALDQDLLAGDYDAVIVTAWNHPSLDQTARTTRAEQFASQWATAEAAGVRVIPVLDNPGVPESSAQCLESSSEFTFESCSFRVDPASETDPLEVAARLAGIPSIDLRAAFCDDSGTCPMVSGGVIVYRDLHHITASFSHSLAPYLVARVATLLDEPQNGD